MGTPEERELFAGLIEDSAITLAENKAACYRMGVYLGSLYASLRTQGVPEAVAAVVLQTATTNMMQGITTTE